MKIFLCGPLVFLLCLASFSACQKKGSRSLEGRYAPVESYNAGSEADKASDQEYKAPSFGLNDIAPATQQGLPQREPLVPLGDLPPRGPKFVPPPVDPYTGGPLVPPPPPPPPPGVIEDDILPVVPFFTTPICGNNILTAGKQCEDGNEVNGDGCSSACKKEYCGNGLVEVGEQCDNGAGRFTIQGPNCDQYCQFNICGDKYVTCSEECDDGNREDCDGCSRDCKVEKIGTNCEGNVAPYLDCKCVNDPDDDDSDDELIKNKEPEASAPAAS